MVSNKSRKILIAVLVVILFSYLFVSKIFIPGLVQREVAKFSEERGVELSINRVWFDLFRGLVLRGAKLGDSVSVERIEVRPSYLSLFSGGITVDNLLVDKPVVTIDDRLPENIIKIQKGQKKDRESSVKIGTIDIDNLVIVLGGKEYMLRELDIDLPPEADDENRIKLFGRVDNESFKQELEFISEIELREDKQLGVDIAMPDLKNGELTDFLRLPMDVSLYVTAVVDYKKGLDAGGKFTVINSNDKTEESVLRFAASHDKENGYLILKTLKGWLGEIITLDMNGSAGNLPEDRVLQLNGELNIPDAASLEPWFPFLERIRISGAFSSDVVWIKKHEDETTVTTSMDADNFRIEFGDENILTASELSPGRYMHFSFRKEEKGTKYIIESQDVRYSGFNYIDYASPGGIIENFLFSYKKDVWDVELSSSGESVINSSLDTMLSDYGLNLRIDNSDGVVISGDIEGVYGHYVNFGLLSLISGFRFEDGKLNFNKLEAGIESYGDIFVEKGTLTFPHSGGGEFLLEINGSKFIYTDPDINSEDIKGLFTINTTEDGSNLIEGKLFAEKALLYGSEITALNLDYYSEGNSYKISNIRGDFSGGKLDGRLNFITDNEDISYDTSIMVKGLGNKSISTGTVNLESKGVFSDGSFKNAGGEIIFTDLYFGSGYTEADFNGEVDITADPETISIENGFISNDEGKRFEFTGGLTNYSVEKNRVFNLNAPEIPVDFLIDVFSAYLPDNTFILDVEGTLAVDFNALNFLTDSETWSGNLKMENSTVSAFINNAEVLIEGVEGSITIREIEEVKSELVGILGSDLTFSRKVFREYQALIVNKADVETKDYLKIGKLKYGFFEMDNIEAKFEMDSDEINLLFLRSDVYRGNIYASGLLNFGKEKELYNVNLLFSDLSLESISESLPSMQGYITGVVDGLMWFSAGNSYTSINGPFAFWAKDSRYEKRTIGRALLERIGATGRFFTGSSRRYDKGQIAGYIKDGFITFKKFIISNKILGYTDLKIQADKRQNSITVKHLLSVIRELARRASRGDVEIEFQ